MTIRGRTQGEFKPDATDAKIGVRRFSYEVKSSRDAATGQASGRRQYGAFTITKEWSPASPQLFVALVNDEVLESVVLEFTREGADHKKTPYYTIKLTNARVSGLRQYTDTASEKEAGLEDVSFTFQTMEVQHAAGTPVRDDPHH